MQSPWNTVRDDEIIRAEIAQDVRRLPEDPFYHQETIQTLIIDILFVYCKLNPSAGGYRQGMHELLAPIVGVIHEDSIARSTGDDEDALMFEVLDLNFVEHDAFAVFARIMDQASGFYEIKSIPGSTAAMRDADTSAIVEKSRFIHEVCLMKVDPELARHMKSVEILPQIFLMWVMSD